MDSSPSTDCKENVEVFGGQRILESQHQKLKEQILSPDGSSVNIERIARQAIRQGANEVLIESMAR